MTTCAPARCVSSSAAWRSSALTPRRRCASLSPPVDQGKLWNVVHLLYANQGAENSGWVSDQLLSGIGAATPGFSTDEAIDEAASAPVHAEIESMAGEASSLGVNGTPAFAAGRTGGELRLVELRSLDAEGLRPALDALLAE